MESPQQALDALQREINLILEQAGRLFVAAAQPSSPDVALARASRLKQQLPVSNNRFHEALDVLDEKLQLTQLVMRRDLAVAREALARGKSVAEVSQQPVEAPQNATLGTEPSQSIEVPSQEPKSEDVVATPPKADSAPEPKPQPAASPKKRPSPSFEDGTSDEPAAKRQAVGDDVPAAGAAQPSDTKLELDTKSTEQASGDHPAEEKAPDTATFSNSGDLDSLFNDPVSAGGVGGENGGEPDFTTNTDLNAEFDFPAFNAGLDANASNDNNDISSLLPGLEDYANNAGGAEPDFSSFFNAEPTTNATDQAQNTGTDTGTGNANGEGEQQNNTVSHGTTFDDLFDLEFDMGGGNNDGQNGGNDFNFDFS